MQPPPDPVATSRAPAVALLVALFLAAAIAELVRIFLNHPWFNVPPPISHTVSAVLAALWIATALAIPLRRSTAFWAQAAWVLAIAGTALMLPHALIAFVLGTPVALAYVPVALVAAILVKKTFDRGEFRTLRREVRAEKPVVPPSPDRLGS